MIRTNTPNPRFSIVTPVYNTDIAVLTSMVESVRCQTHEDWELVLVDDRSTDEAVRRALEAIAASDERIRVLLRPTNGGISAASNAGVEAARGEFVALIDHDDEVREDALLLMSAAIDVAPDVDYLYSDEDKIADDGEHYGAFRKPDWSPLRLLGQMYTSHLSVIRRSLILAVGGFRSDFDGSQDHDLVLRASEQARRVVHVREVLYHWRAVAGSTAIDVGEKSYAWSAGRDAVQSALERRGWRARADLGPVPGTYRLNWSPEPAETTVVLVLPEGTTERTDRAMSSVESIQSAAALAQMQVSLVIVSDAGCPRVDATASASARSVRVDARASRTERLNRGLSTVRTPTVVFLDGDATISEDALVRLLGPLSAPGVGAVGARVIDTDGLIVHAGYRYAAADYRAPYRGRANNDAGEANALAVDREVSAVSSVALAAWTAELFAVGGFSPRLTGELADLDLGRKLATRQLSCIASASALVRLSSRADEDDPDAGWAHLPERWGPVGNDPYTP